MVKIVFLVDSVELGDTLLLLWPEVDVDKAHIGGGLEVAAVVSTVAISGHNEKGVLRVVVNGTGNAKISYSISEVLLFSPRFPPVIPNRG